MHTIQTDTPRISTRLASTVPQLQADGCGDGCGKHDTTADLKRKEANLSSPRHQPGAPAPSPGSSPWRSFRASACTLAGSQGPTLPPAKMAACIRVAPAPALSWSGEVPPTCVPAPRVWDEKGVLVLGIAPELAEYVHVTETPPHLCKPHASQAQYPGAFLLNLETPPSLQPLETGQPNS